jgi:transposase-like protein
LKKTGARNILYHSELGDRTGFTPLLFKYPDEIRKIIYTTNAVEAEHRQFRKVTKQRSIFPNDDALKKMLYLAYRDISKK